MTIGGWSRYIDGRGSDRERETQNERGTGLSDRAQGVGVGAFVRSI